MSSENRWIEAANGLFAFRDSCVVWAVDTGDGMLVVNAGTGKWLGALDDLPAPPKWLICTHFFRDHSAGAERAAGTGIQVWASHWEREQLADPDGLFSRYESYIIYENKWDLFSPVRAIGVNRWLMDWEEIVCGSLNLTVLPAPGVSLGGIGILADDGKQKVLFGGELIHAPGKMFRIAPLQYSYNDLTGALEAKYALGVAKRARPDAIASSTSMDLIVEPLPALDALEGNLRAAVAPRDGLVDQFDRVGEDHLDKIAPNIYQSRHSVASSYFIISESRKALAIDYGYHGLLGFAGFHHLYRNRRAYLHGIEALERDFGIDRLDAVLVTHFHDDHVMGIPMLQRLHGTRCLAGENFSDLIANPESYAFPCTWPEPISVESVPLGTPFAWEEYEFTLHPMSGHTRFSNLVTFESDGEIVCATGDQYFFVGDGNPVHHQSMHNHVYRNGAVLESFNESNELMNTIKPTVILPGHGNGYYVPDEFYRRISDYSADYTSIHASLMPLSDTDIHGEVDSRLGWLMPYRTHQPAAERIVYTAHVRNPYPDTATLSARLVGPDNWVSEELEIELDSRDEGEFEIAVSPPRGCVCRRIPIALEISGPDRPFGQVAEALVTIGYPLF